MLTGNRDVDMEIMHRLDDKDLINLIFDFISFRFIYRNSG